MAKVVSAERKPDIGIVAEQPEDSAVDEVKLLDADFNAMNDLIDQLHGFIFAISPIEVFYQALAEDLINLWVESNHLIDEEIVNCSDRLSWFGGKYNELLCQLLKLKRSKGALHDENEDVKDIPAVAKEFVSQILRFIENNESERFVDIISTFRKMIVISELIAILKQRLASIFTEFFNGLMDKVFQCQTMSDDFIEFFEILEREEYKDKIEELYSDLKKHHAERSSRLVNYDGFDYSRSGQSNRIVDALQVMDSRFIAEQYGALFSEGGPARKMMGMIDVFCSGRSVQQCLQSISLEELGAGAGNDVTRELDGFVDRVGEIRPSDLAVSGVDTIPDSRIDNKTLREILSMSDFELLQLLNEVAIMGVSDSGRTTVQKLVIGLFTHALDRSAEYQNLDIDNVLKTGQFIRCEHMQLYRAHFIRVLCSKLTVLTNSLLGFIYQGALFLEEVAQLCVVLMNKDSFFDDPEALELIKREREQIARKVQFILSWWRNDRYHGACVKSRIEELAVYTHHGQDVEGADVYKNELLREKVTFRWDKFRGLYRQFQALAMQIIEQDLNVLSKTHPILADNAFSPEMNIIGVLFFWLLPTNAAIFELFPYFAESNAKNIGLISGKLVDLVCSTPKEKRRSTLKASPKRQSRPSSALDSIPRRPIRVSQSARNSPRGENARVNDLTSQGPGVERGDGSQNRSKMFLSRSTQGSRRRRRLTSSQPPSSLSRLDTQQPDSKAAVSPDQVLMAFELARNFRAKNEATTPQTVEAIEANDSVLNVGQNQ